MSARATQLFPALFTGSLVMFAVTVCADYQDGLNAYAEGNYRLAMSEWLAVTEAPASEINPAVYAEAHYAVAKLYWQGQGVERDYSRAYEWLTRAAELGHAGAMAKLAYLYTDGIAVQQDFDTAFVWYGKAAKLGNVDGLYNLGIFYLNGWGTEKNVTMAKQYLAAASAQGDAAAEEAFQLLMAEEDALREQELLSQPEEPPIHEEQEAMETLPEPVEAEEVAAILDESWILAQDSEHFTIQVIALSSPEKIEALIDGFENMAPFAIYTVQRSTRPLYVLVQGSYPDVDSARRVRENFPRAIQKTENLWIRKFGMVQNLIEPEADVTTP